MNADSIVRRLAESDPLYDEQIPQPDGRVLHNFVCALCQGEIPCGHVGNCAWWLAHQYVEARRNVWWRRAGRWLRLKFYAVFLYSD